MSDQHSVNANPNDPYGELLDHEYDGIHEYDNPTPGWWHTIFIACVLLVVPYLTFFHWSPIGWSIYDAYQAEMDDYNLKAFGKFGDLTPDNETIASLMANPDILAAVKGTFVSKCASCHLATGGGMVGPNLTDNAYKNITQLSDIYHTIDQGVPAAGMPAWGRQLSKTQVILLASYVASLRDTNVPGGKPAEGNQIAPWPTAPPFVIDENAG
ncbi:MAG: c-type cytochrome [Phycisphaeraceae bacterium]|nr:c-type cytochrome [Phycisphaeraceae bacterium]